MVDKFGNLLIQFNISLIIKFTKQSRISYNLGNLPTRFVQQHPFHLLINLTNSVRNSLVVDTQDHHCCIKMNVNKFLIGPVLFLGLERNQQLQLAKVVRWIGMHINKSQLLVMFHKYHKGVGLEREVVQTMSNSRFNLQTSLVLILTKSSRILPKNSAINLQRSVSLSSSQQFDLPSNMMKDCSHELNHPYAAALHVCEIRLVHVVM